MVRLSLVKLTKSDKGGGEGFLSSPDLPCRLPGPALANA
jgi:hypothetical protein